MLDAVSVLREHGGRGKADARPARRGVRRRQHRARRRAHGQAAGRDRSDHRLPPHPRKNARARLRSRGSAAGRRADQVAVDDQEHGRRGHADRRKDGARRHGLPAADRRIRDPRGRLAGAGAGPGRRSLAARRRAGTRDQGRHRAGGPQHDDRLSGHLRRRRHGAVGAHGDGRRRSRQEGRAPHRRVALRQRLRARAEARARHVRQDEPLVLQRRAEDRAPDARARPPHLDVRRGRQRARRRPTRCSKRAAACPAATASSATTVTACAPTTR